MKQLKLLTLTALCALSLGACQTTGLKPGEVTGTRIGSILASELGVQLNEAERKTMDEQIEKALYFNDDDVTTTWYVGHEARIRPLGKFVDNSGRACRRFRHGQLLSNVWTNGTASACREENVAWYLISNRWDQERPVARRPRPDLQDDAPRGQGQWQTLGNELDGTYSKNSADDFGPRNGSAQGW